MKKTKYASIYLKFIVKMLIKNKKKLWQNYDKIVKIKHLKI